MTGASPVAGRATAIGSWPGTSIPEAVATVIGELVDLPHLVELPARGPGSDMIGRTGAMLVDIELDASPRGYRISGRASRLGRRARDFLAEDLDVLEERWELAGLRGSGRLLKVQAAGPFTLASEVELAGGHRALTDRGALRDLTESLAEGLAGHADEVARRLGAEVVVQIDEPRVGDVLAGTLTGVTSLERIAAVPGPDAAALLSGCVARLDRPVIAHSCADSVPFELFGSSGVRAVSFDLALLAPQHYDAVAEFVEAGGDLVLGVVPAAEPDRVPTRRDIIAPAVDLFDRLGFPRRMLAERVALSPDCGLAGARPSWAKRALGLVGDAAGAFREDPEFSWVDGAGSR